MHWPLLSVGVTASMSKLIMAYIAGMAVTMMQPLAMPQVFYELRQQTHI